MYCQWYVYVSICVLFVYAFSKGRLALADYLIEVKQINQSSYQYIYIKANTITRLCILACQSLLLYVLSTTILNGIMCIHSYRYIF